jgi:hypothetical protein
MEGNNHNSGNQLQRHVAPLKLVSRLLSHEIHAQGGAKSITLSRDEVSEIQTCIDLFIEETLKRSGGRLGGTSSTVAAETHLVPARN